MEVKKGKEKIWFTENVKKPMDAGMLCTIDGDTFHSHTKNRLIGNCGTSCHVSVLPIFLKSPISMNQYREAQEVCLPPNKENFALMFAKLMVQNGYILYGP